MRFLIPVPITKSWECNFHSHSCSQNLGTDCAIPVPVPKVQRHSPLIYSGKIGEMGRSYLKMVQICKPRLLTKWFQILPSPSVCQATDNSKASLVLGFILGI